ncbi:uncharacterized protein J3D65DRAFT_339081 [Phyllosticta citribraziliensis]|uniref:Uncharacterized protein n=1 Tax=Phyllosticta citribraziliensis TaxID=989973 RepID=A0ABR1LTZ3_9PEZI
MTTTTTIHHDLRSSAQTQDHHPPPQRPSPHPLLIPSSLNHRSQPPSSSTHPQPSRPSLPPSLPSFLPFLPPRAVPPCLSVALPWAASLPHHPPISSLYPPIHPPSAQHSRVRPSLSSRLCSCRRSTRSSRPTRVASHACMHARTLSSCLASPRLASPFTHVVATDASFSSVCRAADAPPNFAVLGRRA